MNGGTLDINAPLLDFDMLLNLDPTNSASVVAEPKAESESLIWPVTIMVASVCILLAAVLFLIIILKKIRAKKSPKVVPDPYFKKVIADSGIDMTGINDSFSSVTQPGRTSCVVGPVVEVEGVLKTSTVPTIPSPEHRRSTFKQGKVNLRNL